MSEPTAVKKLKPGDIIRFYGEDRTIASIVPNEGAKTLLNIHLVGLKSVIVEHGNGQLLRVSPA